jgi:hypothetical protein
MITRAQMPRQLRDKGGIASVIPRENYGLGSKIKERFRKLIPNELADVAVAAAPFVAPFNPGVAGLMRGIGRFDQRGSISDALKQGAATFGFGAATRFLGGQRGLSDITGGGLRNFSNPISPDSSLRTVFTEKEGPLTKEQLLKKKKDSGFLGDVAEKTFENVPFSDKIPTKVKEKLLVGGITSGASALYSYFAGEFEPQEPGETMGEYMARRNERVKSQMRIYMDSYYTPLRNPEYAAMTPEQKDNFIDGIVGQAGLEGTTDYQGMKKGGMPTGIMRANKAGVMERDYRDKGGFVPVGIKEKADDVPAMLSKNEFVFTADAVRGAGNGSIEKGAQKMYDTMKNLEKRVT